MTNKAYEVRRDLQEDFITDVKNGNVSDVTEWLDGVIDNAVIYTSDCYEILQDLGVTSFEDYIRDFGEVTSISGLAYYYLREDIHENLDITAFEEVLTTYERYEEILSELEDIENDLEQDEEDRMFDEDDIKNTKEEYAEVVEFLEDFGFEFEKESH